MTQHGATLQAVVKAIHGRRNGGNTTSQRGIRCKQDGAQADDIAKARKLIVQLLLAYTLSAEWSNYYSVA